MHPTGQCLEFENEANFPLIFYKPFHHFKIYFIDFVQRGRERDRELETSMRESYQSAASSTPPTGDMPATNVHMPYRTWDLFSPQTDALSTEPNWFRLFHS